jgi:hypothetical protein
MADPTNSTMREIAYRMLREGMTGEAIAIELLKVRSKADASYVRATIDLVKSRIAFDDEGGPVRWKGPWPVAYVRSTGEPVYRVGAGHDVPEHSLLALGFKK